MDLRATEYRVEDRIAIITLSRPHRGNAWTGRMHAEYKHSIGRAEADPEVRCIIVTGSGKAFCVGGDSEALEGHAERGDYDDGLAAAGDTAPTSGGPSGDGSSNAAPAGFGLHDEFDEQFAYHFGLTKPVIAAINGPAAGVGLALACYADLRFARPGAKLTTAHGKLNLPPEFGLSWLLPRHMGLTRAMDVLMTSRVFTTDEAHDYGLINQLHDPDELLDHTLEYARRLITTVSAASLAATRQQVYLDQHRGVGTSVTESLRLLSEMMGQPDYRKGVKALQERRDPDF